MREIVERFKDSNEVKKIVFAVRQFVDKRIVDDASALTYNTLLSIVPISAVVFAIARGFGFTIYIERWFRNVLVSQPQVAELTIGFVNSYLKHIQSGLILGIGLVFMLYTMVMLTRSVEQAFNKIWHADDRTNIISTLTDYIATFFLIPILIILVSGLSMFVTTMLARSGVDHYLGPVMQTGIDILPFGLMWCAFSAMYVMMPNTLVRFRSTIVPAFVAALAMTVLQWFFINVQMFIANYNAIYGSFSALPLFMLWLQFSWSICLFGAELSYANQCHADIGYTDRAASLSHHHRLLLSFVLLGKVCQRFENGDAPTGAVELSRTTTIPFPIVRDLLRLLAEARILTEIPTRKPHGESTFQPYVTLEKMTVGYVLEHLEQHGCEDSTAAHVAQVCDKDTWTTLSDMRRRYVAELNHVAITRLCKK